MNRTALLSFALSFASVSIIFAEEAVLPSPWQGWTREGLRYDSYDEGARIDCTYSCAKDNRQLQVTISTEKRNIAQAAKKVKAFKDPQYVAVMKSFPGAHIRTWDKDECSFVCEANDVRNSILLLYHPTVMATLMEAGASEEKLVTAFSNFDINAIIAWAKAPYDPCGGSAPPVVIGATGVEPDEEQDMDGAQQADERTLLPPPASQKVTPPRGAVSKNNLSEWLPSIEGLTQKNARSQNQTASVRYADGAGKDVGLRLSTIASEAEGTYGMIKAIEGSPFRMQHFAKSSYDVTITTKGSFKVLSKLSKNVGAPISTISASNGIVTLQVNGPRKKVDQIKQLFEAIDLPGLEKAFPAK